MNAKHPPWHLLSRNRVNRAGVPTFDIMAGDGGPENWEMVADRIDGEANARLISKAWLLPEVEETLDWAMTHVENVFALAGRHNRERPQLEKARALLAKLKEEGAA